MLSNKLSLISGYWHYWLNAVNEHSLHAPFAYNFYKQVIKQDEISPDFLTIEAIRQQFLRSDQIIEIHDLGAGSSSMSNNKRAIRQIARNSLTAPKYSRILYRCIRHMNSENIVELGTSLGINTLYLSCAAPNHQVFTLEGCQATANEANQVFESWPLKNIQMKVGNIDKTLPKLLNTMNSIDFLYIDANHQYIPTMHYYQQCKAKASEESIFVLDDIYWSKEMRKAWLEIQNDPEVSLSLDLFEFGIIFFKKLKNKQHYTLML